MLTIARYPAGYRVRDASHAATSVTVADTDDKARTEEAHSLMKSKAAMPMIGILPVYS